MQRVTYMIVFAVIFILVIGSIHFYLWVRLVKDSRLPEPWRKIAKITIIMLATSIPVAMYLGRGLSFNISKYLAFGPYLWLGMMMLLFFLFGAVDIIKLVINLVARLSKKSPLIASPERRWMLKRTLAGGALALTCGAAAVGVFKATGAAVIHHIKIALPKFPQKLKNFKIVQISDLHIGNTAGKNWLAGLVRQVNELKPDIIAITGDLVDGFTRNIACEIEPLKDLSANFGVYFVTGNHEYYFEADKWIAQVEKLGVRVLRNERVEIGQGDESFYLVGIDDYNAAAMLPDHGQDLASALSGADSEKEVVLLAHQPRAVYSAVRHNVGLLLCGHTHGGQIWPFNYLVKLQQPYNTGLHQYNARTQIYINQGTGVWGPPMRTGTHNEITCVRFI